MPELPEVEVAARNLRRWAGSREIRAVSVEANAARVIRPAAPADLRALEGARVTSIARIGKHLLLTCEKDRGAIGVLSHLGMTGKWLCRDERAPAPPHARLHLRLDDGHVLHYCDLRLFGRFRIVPGARFESVPEIAGLGPDPLATGVDVERLRAALGRTRQAVKVAIMDQALLPGVGNIQASEALFRAAVDPRRPGNTIKPAEAGHIAEGVLASIRDTLADFHAAHYDAGGGAEVAYVEEGAPNTFRVYDRAGEPCPRCPPRSRARIERVVLGGRSTYFCPRCQR